MLFSKMSAYRFVIILSFLLVLCVCDNNEPTTYMVDSKHRAPEIDVIKGGDDSGKCLEPGREGDPCDECCSLPSLTCHNHLCMNCNDPSGEIICGSTPYETASRISLSIAMALGIIILLVVLWKMCVTPKHLRYSRRARARMLGNENTPRSEEATRTSISSIQNRIVARLQNRPPRYESSYNYNQRIEAAKQEAIVDEAPPAYDATIVETVEKGPPPPYTIDLDASTRQGIDNNSFIADEHSSLRNTNTSNPSLATNPGLNTTHTAANNRSATINCGTVHI